MTENNIIENIFNSYNDKTIILISHNTSTLEKCDHIYEIKNSGIKNIK